jgi:outer membrane receptor for ferrienterochelin and colicin
MDLSRNNLYSTGAGVGATKYALEKYSFQLNTNFTWFYSLSSINASARLHYWTQSHSAMLTILVVPHYEFGVSAFYSWQQRASAFSSNTSVLLWNGSASRKVLHDKLVLRVALNNILDQNTGISRTNSNNTNTQTATNILGRYWMLSVMYHFDKKFKKK